MRIESRIPNLINGVSQQAPSLRLPSQLNAQTNGFGTVVSGLSRRPPTEHKGRLTGDKPTAPFVHFAFRDETEKFVIAIYDGQIRVWDMAGLEQTVTMDAGTADYLTGLSDPRNQLRALTTADYTFILNTTKAVAASTAIHPTRPNEAVVNVLAGNFARKYEIEIDGVVKASYETPDGSVNTHEPTADTEWIADQLFQDLVANGFNTAPWQVGKYHNAIVIRNNTADFRISVRDGYGGNAMKASKGRVNQFTDLPNYGNHGFTIMVAGSDETGGDDYWVRFEKDGNSDLAQNGIWKECPAPGSRKGLNAATMPHALVRQSNGTFRFQQLTWGERESGDNTTSPDPSFVGRRINGLFFHRNRFGFLSDENVIMSRNGGFWDFYRQSMTALLDDDPIDVGATHREVAILRHAVAMQEMLLLWSDRCQFRFAGNELLSPKTASLRPLTEYPTSRLVTPTLVGSSIYYTSDRGNFCGLFEYVMDKALETADSQELSSHVPQYIRSGVRHIAASPNHGMVAVYSPLEPNWLTIYNHYTVNGERLQSAFHKWNFPHVERIAGMTEDTNLLYLVTVRSDGMHLETVRIDQGAVDTGFNGLVGLDQRRLVTPEATIYDPGVAYQPGVVAVTAPGGSIPAGVQFSVDPDPDFPISSEQPYAPLRIPDEFLDQPIYIGYPIAFSATLSELVYRRQMPNGGSVVEQSGRTQVTQFTVHYNNTNHFEIAVTLQGRAQMVYEFEGRVIPEADVRLDVLPDGDGRFTVPIMSRADRATVVLRSTGWTPLNFTSADWRGTFNPHNRQL